MKITPRRLENHTKTTRVEAHDLPHPDELDGDLVGTSLKKQEKTNVSAKNSTHLFTLVFVEPVLIRSLSHS